MNNYAWATLATTQDYIKGAILLYKKMQYVKSKYPVVIMVTDNITDFSLFKEFNVPYKLIPRYQFSLLFRGKTRYQDTINKFQIFNLLDYDKVFFIDSDIFIFKNIDWIFEERSQYHDSFIFWYREGSYEDKTVCGECFIIKPKVSHWNFIVRHFKDRAQTDEQIIKILFYNYIIKEKVKDFFSYSEYMFHNAAEDKILRNLNSENLNLLISINNKQDFDNLLFGE